MKNFYLFVILSFLSFTDRSYSQDYFPFPTDSAIWSEIRLIYGGGPGLSVALNYSYSTIGDTAINNNFYKIIGFRHEWTRTHHDVFGTNIILSDSPYKAVGAIREEDKKVYFYDFGLTTSYHESAFDHLTPNVDNLIYDFNINAGDTLFWKPYMSNDYSVLHSIDSITLDNGQVRRKFNFIAYGYLKDFWIEGIGSSQGFLGSFNTVMDYDYSPFLLCFTENNEYLYNDTLFFDGCETKFTIPEEEEPEEEVEEPEEEEILNLYPNPFNTNLTVTNNFKDHPQIKIKIYSITGSLFKSFVITEKLVLETNDFASGFYFIQILDIENNLLLEKKILKF